MRAHLIMATAVLLTLAAANAAEVYRWLDKDGQVHYSDTPPPANARNPELKKLGKNAVEVDKTAYATRDAAKKNPVALYANNCGTPCDSARQLLAKRGIPFASKNPESSEADAEALKKLVGALEVPVLVVGRNTVKGFEASSWEAALDTAGYPRIAPFVAPSPIPPTSPASTAPAKPAAAAPAAAEGKAPLDAPTPR